MNSALMDENKYAEVDLGFIMENKELLSNTIIILIPYSDNIFLLLSGESFPNNSSLLLDGSSESSLLNRPFFAFLPNSTYHLISSCSSLDLDLSNNCLFNISLLTSAVNNLDKSIPDFSACFMTSSGIEIVNSAMKEITDEEYINVSYKGYCQLIVISNFRTIFYQIV